MVSAAVAHLPAVVSLLLLEVLFMQIAGVSLTLTWPHRLCLLRVLLCVTATATSFPLSKHTGGGDTALAFTWEVGLPPSPVEFSFHCHFYKFSPSWLLGWCSAILAFSGWHVVRDFLSPLFGAQGALPSLLCVFFVLIAYYSIFFFIPWVGIDLSRGLCWMLCEGWGCGGVKVLPLLGGFFYNVYLQRLSKILL
jgi:hypothetical protein